jgi:MoaA/NifB/PqqE/SkfB family radical SAM enzyme
VEVKDDLSKEEIFSMLKKAKEVGIFGYSVWGGEPLLRKDLPEILEFAKKMGLITMVITNGYFLKDRYKEILPHTDYLIVSIDFDDDMHDEMRGAKGIWKRAIEGIELCKGSKTKVVINSVITNLNYNKVEGLLDLSRRLGVMHAFEAMDITEEYFKPANAFRPTEDQLKVAFSKMIELKKKGYNVYNSVGFLENFSKKKKYTCHFPKIFIIVDAHGNISSCQDNSWGSIKNTDFKKVFSSPEFKKFCKKVEACNKCNVACVVESSFAYSLNPYYLFNEVAKILR